MNEVERRKKTNQFKLFTGRKEESDKTSEKVTAGPGKGKGGMHAWMRAERNSFFTFTRR